MKFKPIKGLHRNADPMMEPEGEIDQPDDFQNHGSLVTMVKAGMAALQSAYPGWQWGIQINERGGMVDLFNLTLHSIWGYRMRIVDIQCDPTSLVFMRAGGEILERFGMPRHGIDWNRVALMKRDARGHGIPILNDLEHAAARKELKRRRLSEAIQAGRTWTDEQGRTIIGVV